MPNHYLCSGWVGLRYMSSLRVEAEWMFIAEPGLDTT